MIVVCTRDAIISFPYSLFSDYGEDKPGQTPLPMDKREEGRKDANLVFLFLAVPQTQPVGQESDAEISLILSIPMLSSGQYRDEPSMRFIGEHRNGRTERRMYTPCTGTRACRRRKLFVGKAVYLKEWIKCRTRRKDLNKPIFVEVRVISKRSIDKDEFYSAKEASAIIVAT